MSSHQLESKKSGVLVTKQTYLCISIRIHHDPLEVVELHSSLLELAVLHTKSVLRNHCPSVNRFGTLKEQLNPFGDIVVAV